MTFTPLLAMVCIVCVTELFSGMLSAVTTVTPGMPLATFWLASKTAWL